MNIYYFANTITQENTKLIDAALNEVKNISFGSEFRDELLSSIEGIVKYEILHIIYYESKLSIKSGLAKDDNDFIINISNNNDWLNYFFEVYPPLKKYILLKHKAVCRFAVEIIKNLDKDFGILGIKKGDELLSLEFGLGDFHGGKTTSKLTFKNNILYYKPRSLKTDIEILSFFKKIEKITNKHVFHEVKNIDNGIYGWSFGVEVLECKNIESVKKFYFGIGMLTAFCHALNIEDLIFENIISTSGKIALIDLECAFCNKHAVNKDIQFTLNSIAGEIYRNSVINTGILPRHTVESNTEFGESDGSLSFLKVRKRYTRKFVENNSNATELKNEITEYISDETHVPKLDSLNQPIRYFLDDYISGFEYGYMFVTKNKALFFQFLDSLIKKNVETRILWRPTKVYSMIIQESFNPEYLEKKRSRQKLFKNLYKGIDSGLSKNIIISEIRQLENHDIPYFKKVFGFNEVYDYGGGALNVKYSGKTDYEDIKYKINNFSASDYQNQIKIILNSLKIFENIEDKFQLKEINKVFSLRNADKDIKELMIEKLLQYLKNKLYINEKDVSCIDIISNNNNQWDNNLVPAGLSNGMDGVALVFGINSGLTGKRESLEISRIIIQKNFKNFKTVLQKGNIYKDRDLMFSSLQFPLSTFYTNFILKKLFNYNFVDHNEFEKLIFEYFNKWLHKDEDLDFLTGCTGAIFLFYQLYLVEKKSNYLNLIKQSGDLLINHSIINNNYAYWSRKGFDALGGFSHGNSSFLVALLITFKATGEDIYFEVFKKALNYDRSLFDKNSNLGYIDKRHLDNQTFSHAWAHGTGGIALSRLLIDELLPNFNGITEELYLCRNILEKSITDYPYSLNGGWVGNFEILKAINRRFELSNSHIDDRINEYVKKFYDSPNHFISEVNHIHLFMNQGLLGLAYFLYREIYGKKIPSFLISGINSSFCSVLYE